MRLSKIRFFIFFIFLFITTSLAANAQAEVSTKNGVLLVPFTLRGETDSKPLKKELMESFAKGLVDSGCGLMGMEIIKKAILEDKESSFSDVRVREVAVQAGAKFALTGALTILGKTFNLDLKLEQVIEDAKETTAIKFFNKSTTQKAKLLKWATVSATKVCEEVTLRSAENKKLIKNLSGKKLHAVNISGARRIDSEAITKKLKSTPGGTYSAETIRTDIQSIFAMGYFDDITAEVFQTPVKAKDIQSKDKTQELILVFTVKEKPVISKVKLEGNDELSEEKIRGAFTLKTHTLLNRRLIKEAAERIRILYTEEGFYLAKVKAGIEVKNSNAKVTFKIDEGEKVRVKQITILGASAFTEKEIKKIMMTKQKWALSFLTGSGKFSEFAFEADLAMIMKHYLDNGYINAEIRENRVLLGESKKWLYITIALSEGNQYTLGKVNVEGDLLKDRLELIKAIGVEPGEVFNRSELSAGIEALRGIYGDKGFAYAEFKPSTLVDEDKKRVDLNLHITKHDPVYLEKIEISGNVKTRDKVIRRELEVLEGELFSLSAFKRSRSNLRRLGYFEDVKFTESEGSTRARIKLKIDVKEVPTGALTLGMGYSSTEKLMGTTSISQSNFLGTGLKLNIMANISSTSSRFNIGITEPWLFDKPISAGFDLFNTAKEYQDFTMDKTGGALRLGFPLYKRSTKMSLRYGLEFIDIREVDETASDTVKDQEGETTVSSASMLITHDTRDDFFFPTEGSVLKFSTKVAGGLLGGSTNYVRYEGSALHFFPLPWWKSAISLRGTLGHVHSFGGETLPIYERYFIGGMNSIRGFRSRTISPYIDTMELVDTSTGSYWTPGRELIGGETEAFINTEFLFPLFPEQRIKGVVFYDIGNSYDGGIDFDEFRHGTGVGIRWFSPMGPLRLEWGYNLDPWEGERQKFWEFTIGGFF